jgi:hypothetical protein
MTIYKKPDSQSSGIVPDIETLELIASWKEDLQARLSRVRLRFELSGLNREEIIQLESEVADFTRCCRTLKAVIQ